MNLLSDTEASEKVSTIILNSSFCKDIVKLSPLHHTSSLESFHSVIIHFAPKHTAFSYHGMIARYTYMFDSNFCNIMLLIFRHQLAALHFNENSNRDQAVTQEGTSRYKIIFPKYKRGGYVVRKVPTDPTYGEPIASTHKLANFHIVFIL